MADQPVNEKLYAMVVAQAKAKYTTYPSPGASHWVHRRYLELGGKFEDTSEASRREKIAKQMMKNYRREGLVDKTMPDRELKKMIIEKHGRQG